MEFSEQLLAVVLVLAILGGALWVLKSKGLVQTRFRRPNGSSEPVLQVVDRLVLTPQHSVHLIRVADRTLLVGLSPSGCNLLESSQAGSTPTNFRGAAH